MERAFLSYAVEDRHAVEQVSARLSTIGIRTWIDDRSLRPGEEWPTAIEEAVRKATCFIIAWSRNYQASLEENGFLMRELLLGLGILKDTRGGYLRSDKKAPVVLLRLDDVQIETKKQEVTEMLRALQWIDVLEGQETNWKRLLDAVDPLGFFRFEETWVYREGVRDRTKVRFDPSTPFGTTRAGAPPEEFLCSVWTHCAYWKVDALRIEGADLDVKRVGILHSRSTEELEGTIDREGRTVLLNYDADEQRQRSERWIFEHWRQYDEWTSTSPGSLIISSRLAVVAWYQDGLGNTYYDDNGSEGYLVVWEPHLGSYQAM